MRGNGSPRVEREIREVLDGLPVFLPDRRRRLPRFAMKSKLLVRGLRASAARLPIEVGLWGAGLLALAVSVGCRSAGLGAASFWAVASAALFCGGLAIAVWRRRVVTRYHSPKKWRGRPL